MPHVNVIWQGDANSWCLRSFAHCQSPPFVLNITGPETLSVREVAAEFGKHFGVEPTFGHEASDPTSLLNDASKANKLFGQPRRTPSEMIDWIADWIRQGGNDAEQAHAFPDAGRKILMQLREKLRSGLVIPAHPLALNAQRKLDERRQRALTRYYLAAGAGGVAVGCPHHAVRDPRSRTAGACSHSWRWKNAVRHDVVKIAGVCGKRAQAVAEAQLAARLGYDAALLSLADLREESIAGLLEHARADRVHHSGHGLLSCSPRLEAAFCRTNSGDSSSRLKM